LGKRGQRGEEKKSASKKGFIPPCVGNGEGLSSLYQNPEALKSRKRFENRGRKQGRGAEGELLREKAVAIRKCKSQGGEGHW